MYPQHSVTDAGGRNYRQKDEQLLEAIEAGQLDKVKQLVSSGIQLNTVLHSKARQESTTILGTAAYEGQLEILKYLVSCNVALNYQDPCMSRNALHWACMGGHCDVVEFLLRNQIDVNCQDRDNVTPIIRAAIAGSSLIVQELIKNGANVNQCDRLHSTALHYASFHGKSQIVKQLICAGCIPNYPAIFGQGTPLANLFYHGDANNCRLLLKAGYSLELDSWIIHYQQDSHMSGARETLVQFITHEYQNPSSLSRLCLHIIRKTLGGICVQEKIEQLPLPNKLVNYLQLS